MEFNNKKTARLTGILYLLVIICAGFSHGYVRGTLFVQGDQETTLANIMASEGLFRLGLATDLIAFLMDAVISILLYKLLKEVSKTLATVAATFRVLAHPGIASLNLVNHFMAIETATSGGYVSTLGIDQQETWTMLFLQAHNYGYLLAGAFFGIHCLLLGVLLYKSNMIPNIFGILMTLAAFGYLVETFGNIMIPGYEGLLAIIVGFSAAVGEVSLTCYFLIKGIRNAD